MLDIRYHDLDAGITCIDTQLQRPGLASCYLIVQDGVAGFIDTGTNNSVPILLEVLRRKGLTEQDVAYVIPTHVHLDHAGGAGGLIQACSNARLLVHPRGARHMIDPGKLEAGSLAVYGEARFSRLFGRVVPIPEERVDIAEEGFELDFNGRLLRFMDTPGHARHHFCVFDEQSNGMFTGDTMGASYPELNQGRAPYVFPPTTPVQFDPDAWLATIDRILELNLDRLYVTHFGMHKNVQAYGEQLKAAISEYVKIAEESSADEGSAQEITSALLDLGVNRLLDSDCGVELETIRELLRGDMALNSQGLVHWLATRQ